MIRSLDAGRLANGVLDDPIEIPARCDQKRLLERVGAMPVTETEKLRIYEASYLGNQDAEFGRGIRQHFSSEALDEYWRRRFSRFRIDQNGFRSAFSEYLLWGFDLAGMFRFIDFKDKEGIPQYEKFIRMVMDAKLHLEEKDCSDPLRIDKDSPDLHGVYAYLAQAMFGGVVAKEIDRHIPLGEIRIALEDGLGDRCDVGAVIDAWLAEEGKKKRYDLSEDTPDEEVREALSQDNADAFRQIMDIKADQLQRKQDSYDISEHERLLFYEDGDTIYPGLMESLGLSYIVYHGLCEEECFKELMGRPPIDRCRFLVEENRYILLRDKDWEKIFDDIHGHEESFARYYSMVRVSITSDPLVDMVRAMVINDDLYEYCKELAEVYGGVAGKSGENA